jgi:FkbM family methyltransferase
MNRIMLFKKFAGYGAKLGLGKSQKFVNLYEELLSKIGSDIHLEYVEIDGQKLFLDKEDSLLLSIRKDNYDKFEIDCLKKIIKKDDNVVDLGANIGLYSIILAKLVGKGGQVFSFEPDPSNFKLLSKNIEINKHDNVTLVQKAVSDKTSKTKLYISKRNFASHRIFDSEDKRDSIEIDVIKLDEYFEKFQKPVNFIKMDIEGVEGAAISGASNLIKNLNDFVILLEYFPKWIKKFGNIPEELLLSLREQNFELFNLNKISKKIEPIIISDFILEYNENKKNYTNILCIKGKKLNLSILNI